MASPFMRFNSDLFSAKIERSTVLINNVNHQVRNAPCDDWKVNDLCRRFRYLISWWYVRRNSYIVCMHLSLVYAPEVTLHSTRIMFTLIIFIGTSDTCYCRGSIIRFDENPKWSNVVGFDEIYRISALDLTLHRIVVDANYQQVLALTVFIYAKHLFHDIVWNCAFQILVYIM